MKLKFAAAILLLSVLSVSADKARFDNYRVYVVDVETQDQLSVLRELSETSDSVKFVWNNFKADYIMKIYRSMISGTIQLQSTRKFKLLFHPISLHTSENLKKDLDSTQNWQMKIFKSKFKVQGMPQEFDYLNYI